MTVESLKNLILETLDDMKASDTRVLDVRELTSITDYMIITTGTSHRHVKAMADRVAAQLRDEGLRATGCEGMEQGEWVLLDYGDVVLHLMHPEARSFYDLEKLWSPEVKEMIRRNRNTLGE